MRDLVRVNPDFYPVPEAEEASADPKVKVHAVEITDGFLTKQEFVRVYKKCSAMMHARNPYGSKTGHHYFEKAIPEWRAKIVKLLNVHRIKVLGHPGFWLIHMHEVGDDEVHYYEFVLAE